jgi:hypothetical protein
MMWCCMLYNCMIYSRIIPNCIICRMRPTRKGPAGGGGGGAEDVRPSTALQVPYTDPPYTRYPTPSPLSVAAADVQLSMAPHRCPAPTPLPDARSHTPSRCRAPCSSAVPRLNVSAVNEDLRAQRRFGEHGKRGARGHRRAPPRSGGCSLPVCRSRRASASVVNGGPGGGGGVWRRRRAAAAAGAHGALAPPARRRPARRAAAPRRAVRRGHGGGVRRRRRGRGVGVRFRRRGGGGGGGGAAGWRVGRRAVPARGCGAGGGGGGEDP